MLRIFIHWADEDAFLMLKIVFNYEKYTGTLITSQHAYLVYNGHMTFKFYIDNGRSYMFSGEP